MGSNKTSGGRKTGSPLGCCCYSAPLVQLLCCGVILAGAIIFLAKSGTSFNAVNTLMADLKVMRSAQKTIRTISSALLGSGAAVLFTVFGLAFLATIATISGRMRRYRYRHGSSYKEAGGCNPHLELTIISLVIFFLWIFLALVVAMIALWTTFFLGSFSGDHGASFAMGTTDKLQEKIAKALKKADSLFAKMRKAWDGLVDRVPSLLKNSTWFQELTRDIGGPILTGSNDLTEVSCAENCLDLGVFATMMSFEPRCVCGHEMLTSIKSKMRVAWTDSVWSLAALGAIAIAGSWIFMSSIASWVHSKRDLRDMKRAQQFDPREQPGYAPAPAPEPGFGRNDVEGGIPDQYAGAK